jgi:hypothetical protein
MPRNGSYQVIFRYHRKQHPFKVSEVSQDETTTAKPLNMVFVFRADHNRTQNTARVMPINPRLLLTPVPDTQKVARRSPMDSFLAEPSGATRITFYV